MIVKHNKGRYIFLNQICKFICSLLQIQNSFLNVFNNLNIILQNTTNPKQNPMHLILPLQPVSSRNRSQSSRVFKSPLPIIGQLTLSTTVCKTFLLMLPVNCDGVLAWTVKKLTPAFSSCRQTSTVFL